ncbi:phosphatase [Domibacillus sp. 8LH]|uniref:arsenate reductase/protein-tyrosine-phosphatase family protein n=1 Tax=Domibacillus TaxID=1433999 RepID=UPI001F57E511|nr:MULTISPECIES: phosphatase [Domibacillus]MCI2253523.1 phosphatase [Domibacillus sp. PGB-M46]MCM3787986.1 phosphatase [Domibacillus indicus]
MKNKTILFLSPFNHLSMMAEGWAARLNEPSWNVISAACSRADYDALPVKAMKEVNIDIESKTPHSLKPQLVNEADIVVAIYDFQRDSLPALLNESEQKVLRWNIFNPIHCDHLTDRWAAYQEVCDELAVKIQELKKQLI